MRDVFALAGGWDHWRDLGYPVEPLNAAPVVALPAATGAPRRRDQYKVDR